MYIKITNARTANKKNSTPNWLFALRAGQSYNSAILGFYFLVNRVVLHTNVKLNDRNAFTGFQTVHSDSVIYPAVFILEALNSQGMVGQGQTSCLALS